jgi:DUF971 family protein
MENPAPAHSPTNLHLQRDQSLTITWDDTRTDTLPLRILRRNCPCAGCQGERDLLGNTLLPVISTRYDGPITARSAHLVGNYALQIDWSDGHTAGIFTFKLLRELGDEQHSSAKANDANSPSAP